MSSVGEAPGIDLDCGIACHRITNWLDDELRLPRENASWLYHTGPACCYIHVTPLESRTFGTIALERTHLIAHGDAEALESFRKAFTLRFMSAGG